MKKKNIAYKPAKNHPWKSWRPRIEKDPVEKLFKDYVMDNVRHNTPKVIAKKSFHS